MSKTVILRNFSFTRDFRSIMWKETLWYNFLRNICAGIVCGFIMAFAGKGLSSIYEYPLMWPFAYAIITPCMLIICSILGAFIPVINYVPVVLAIFIVAVGDPIVSILYKFYPKIVPVTSPPIFSTNLIFWVLNTDNDTAVAGDLFNPNEPNTNNNF